MFFVAGSILEVTMQQRRARFISTVIISEYLHLLVLLTLLSVAPILLVKHDSNGTLLSISSVAANASVMFLLPIVAKYSKSIAMFHYLIVIRILSLCSVLALVFQQIWWVICLVHASALLALTLQQINTNRCFAYAATSLTSQSIFRFENGCNLMSSVAAIGLFVLLTPEKLELTPLLLAGTLCLLANIGVLFRYNHKTNGKTPAPEPHTSRRTCKRLTTPLKLLF